MYIHIIYTHYLSNIDAVNLVVFSQINKLLLWWNRLLSRCCIFNKVLASQIFLFLSRHQRMVGYHPIQSPAHGRWEEQNGTIKQRDVFLAGTLSSKVIEDGGHWATKPRLWWRYCFFSRHIGRRGMTKSVKGPNAPWKLYCHDLWHTVWLVVGPPLWKIWTSIGMTIPNIWENKKCSKPPTSSQFGHHATFLYISGRKYMILPDKLFALLSKQYKCITVLEPSKGCCNGWNINSRSVIVWSAEAGP